MMSTFFLTSDAEGVWTRTRFILPIRYGLTAVGHNSAVRDQPFRYREEARVADDHPDGRRDYFTPETGRVLYDRARWFTLDKSGQPFAHAWTFPYGTKNAIEVRAEIEAVRIVLFEPSTEDDTKSRLLRSGFLMVDVILDSNADGGLPKTLFPEILCNFNEVYRYWRPPFPDVLADRGFPNDAVLDPPPARPDVPPGCDDVFADRWRRWLGYPLEFLPDRGPIQGLHQLISENRRTHDPTSKCTKHIQWPAPPADPRAFVWTAASTPEADRGVNAFLGAGKDPIETNLRKCGELLKLVNVDRWADSQLGEAAAPPSEFDADWLKGRLYTRWAGGEGGTVYGFSPHSGALLCARLPKPNIVEHFFSLYSDQTLLLLYVKSLTFAFSERLSDISATAASNPEIQKARLALRQEFSDLRYAFALFTNMYQFPLLSSQQQGMEIYGIQRLALDVDELFKEVEKEIATTDDFLASVEQENLGHEASMLNGMAGIGLVVSLLLAALQINAIPWTAFPATMQDVEATLADRAGNLVLFAVTIIPLLLAIFLHLRSRNSGKRRSGGGK